MNASSRICPARSDAHSPSNSKTASAPFGNPDRSLFPSRPRKIRRKLDRRLLNRRVVPDQKDRLRLAALRLDDRQIIVRLEQRLQEPHFRLFIERRRDAIPGLARPRRVGGEHEVDRFAELGDLLADRLRLLRPSLVSSRSWSDWRGPARSAVAWRRRRSFGIAACLAPEAGGSQAPTVGRRSVTQG